MQTVYIIPTLFTITLKVYWTVKSLFLKVKEKKELTLEDIFKNYDGEYVAEEFGWGSPVGKEVW